MRLNFILSYPHFGNSGTEMAIVFSEKMYHKVLKVYH